MTVQLFGIDVGASDVKAVSGHGSVLFTSAVSPFVAHTSLGETNRRGGIRFITGKRTNEYLYGELGAIHSLGVPTIHGDYRLQGSETLALYLAAIMELYAEPELRAKCVIGVPAMLANDANAIDTLTQTLSGRHRCELLLCDGKYVESDITLEVLQVMSQPNGTALDFLTDEKAQQKQGVSADGQIAVLDIGGETTDVSRLTELVVDRSGSLRFGMRDVERSVAESVKEEHDIELDALAMRRAVVLREVWVSGVRRDVTGIVNAHLAHAAETVIRFFLATLKSNGDELRYILLSGGGARLLGGAITRRFPQTRLVSDPVMSNAKGFYKKGLRLTR